MSKFTGSFKTEWLVEEGLWKILESFEFHSGEKDSGLFVRCLAGELTDLTSIPRICRIFIRKHGREAQASAIHDKCYKTGRMLIRMEVGGNSATKSVVVSRGMADSLYYQAMVVLKVHWFRRELIYRGLKIGGWIKWNEYRLRS